MLEGKCPKCGSFYYGWALRFPRNQYCNECGTALEIREQNNIIQGYSPFSAEEYHYKKDPADPERQKVTGDREKN